MLFKPVETRRTFEEAVLQIAAGIRRGELRIGDRLPGERRAAEQMQISRPTFREAVRVLENAGVLEVTPGPGGGIVVVSEYIPSRVLERRSELRVHEVGSVLEARRMLEPLVAHLAGLRAEERSLDAMEKSIAQQRELISGDGTFFENEDRFLQLDVQFHMLMAKATENATVVSLMAALLEDLEIARDMAFHVPLVPAWAVGDHEVTLAAIRRGDPQLIDAAMDQHLSRMEGIWEQETGRTLVPTVPEFLKPSSPNAIAAAKRSSVL